MCTISSKIKFCTCNTPAHKLRHSWTFHSYVGDTGTILLGTPVFPVDLPEALSMANEETLEQRLNEPDAFDVDLEPKENDRLEVHLSCNTDHESGFIHYGFEFQSGHWKSIGYDYFEWKWQHKKRMHGKLLHPF
jgi:hypothetical protein